MGFLRMFERIKSGKIWLIYPFDEAFIQSRVLLSSWGGMAVVHRGQKYFAGGCVPLTFFLWALLNAFWQGSVAEVPKLVPCGWATGEMLVPKCMLSPQFVLSHLIQPLLNCKINIRLFWHFPPSAHRFPLSAVPALFIVVSIFFSPWEA